MNKAELEKWLTGLIGQKPGDLELYVRAFTHGSFGEKDYQRLEFLGDRVLGLTISSQLYMQFPDEPEGNLSQRLNGLVSGKVCGEVARTLDMSAHLRLGKQARDDGARQSIKVLGDVMESLIGAIYLDLGIETARAFILEHWKDRISGMGKNTQHPKSALQEWTASSNRKMPFYELVDKSGPHHDLRFTVRVSVNNVGDVEATSSSIQTAETAAAKLFLETYT